MLPFKVYGRIAVYPFVDGETVESAKWFREEIHNAYDE
jgi:hypothetical protein